MHVRGQDHPGIDVEGGAPFCVADCGAQEVDLVDQQMAAVVVKIDREEKCAARYTVAPVVGHFGMPSDGG
jgi:hypothetical protein